MNNCVRSAITTWATLPKSRPQWPPLPLKARQKADMRRAAVLALALLLGPGALHAAAESDLQRQQADARRERQALRERMRDLEKRAAGSESSRRGGSVQLTASETATAELDRRLEELAADTREAQAALKDAQQRIAKQTGVQRERQAQLADQLRG